MRTQSIHSVLFAISLVCLAKAEKDTLLNEACNDIDYFVLDLFRSIHNNRVLGIIGQLLCSYDAINWKNKVKRSIPPNTKMGP